MKTFRVGCWTMIYAADTEEDEMVVNAIRRIPLPASRLSEYDDQVPVAVVDLCRQRWADVLAKRSGISRDSGGILSPVGSKGRDQLIWTLRSAESVPPWPQSGQSPSVSRTQATPKGIVHKLRSMCAWFLNFSANDERMHHYQRRRASITGLGL
jgi:hypothetical protein